MKLNVDGKTYDIVIERKSTTRNTYIRVKPDLTILVTTNKFTTTKTITNLIEEGVVGKTDDERFYYDDLGFKALETKFVRGYSMIFIVPIVIALLVYVLQIVL